jgi:hypothetical protein
MGLLLLPSVLCRSQPIDEHRFLNLQAAYIYNITKFVQWPDLQAAERFEICLLGSGMESLKQSLSVGVSERRIQDKQIDVIWLNDPQQTQEIGAAERRVCHLVYLADIPELDWESTELFSDNQVLRIQAPGSDSSGRALVDLVLEKGKIALYLNGEELARSSLSVSPALLNIAKRR